MACAVPGTGAGFLKGTLDFIDCQTMAVGGDGYQALASPGSPVALALTAFLTLFIAITGIRLLRGETLSAGVLIPLGLKLGIVLALAGSWGAYRVVVYDVVLRGPAELLSVIGGGAGLDGSGFVDRLQAVDDGIVAFTTAGTAGTLAQAAPDGAAAAVTTPHIPLSDDLAFGLARLAWLGGTIGALGLVRLSAGLLLALGPLFAGTLLFDATRVFFMGWIRGLLASALGALGVTLVLSIALAFLEPWLTTILALHAVRIATPAAPLELLALTAGMMLVAWGMLFVAFRIAFTPSTGTYAWSGFDHARAPATLAGNEDRMLASGPLASNAPSLSRAQQLAIAVAERSSSGRSVGGERSRPLADSVRQTNETRRAGIGPALTPLGQSHRRTASRISGAGTARSAR